MEKNCKKHLIYLTETIFSTFVCAIGVCLFIDAGIGSDAIDVLIEGIHKSFRITVGQADLLYSTSFLLLALILIRKYIGFYSIVYTVTIGIFIDIVNLVILPLNLSECPYFVRVTCVFAGEFCFAVSYGLFQTIENGMNPIDAVVYYITGKTNIPYAKIRTIFDAIFFLTGYFMGGVAGVGTIISVLFTGVITRTVYQQIVKWKKKIGLPVMKLKTVEENG